MYKKDAGAPFNLQITGKDMWMSQGNNDVGSHFFLIDEGRECVPASLRGK